VIVSPNVSKDASFTIKLSENSLESLVFVSDDNVVPINVISNYLRQGTFDDAFISSITTASANETMITTHKMIDVSEDISQIGAYGFTVPSAYTMQNFMINGVSVTLSQYNHIAKPYRTYYASNVNYNEVICYMEYVEMIETYTIPACGASNEVKKIDIYGCDGVSSVVYPDAGYSDPLSDDGNNGDEFVSCSLPQTARIDISAYSNRQAQDIVGLQITSTTLTGSPYTIDNYGFITVTVDTAEDHELDCTTVQKGAKIYIRASGAI